MLQIYIYSEFYHQGLVVTFFLISYWIFVKFDKRNIEQGIRLQGQVYDYRDRYWRVRYIDHKSRMLFFHISGVL